MFFHMVYKSGQIFLPFCHNARVWRTDRRTDRILIARPRLHCMQRGNDCNRETLQSDKIVTDSIPTGTLYTHYLQHAKHCHRRNYVQNHI